jgi:hypothetical protein
MTTLPVATPRRFPGRSLLALGPALAALGILGYILQLAWRHLAAPWYLPALGTLGVVCVAAALWQRRTVWRWLALVLILLVAGAEWAFLLGTRLPAYAGPVAAGQPFPEFTTMRADGTPFSRRDLEGDQDNVLVFFRGRW